VRSLGFADDDFGHISTGGGSQPRIPRRQDAARTRSTRVRKKTTMSDRTLLLAGNWKMNHDHLEAISSVQKLAWALEDAKLEEGSCEVVVIPPFTDIRSVQTLVQGDKLWLKYGAQDVSQHEPGAHTGEIAASFLSRLGCAYVVIGHSERRADNHETNEIVAAKIRAALSAELTPILCVGESLEQRQERTHIDFTLGQLEESLAGLGGDELDGLVIAYEPVWAIGTGETATAADAAEMASGDPRPTRRDVRRRDGRIDTDPLRRFGQDRQRLRDRRLG
jgi:triosephosphate isomerase